MPEQSPDSSPVRPEVAQELPPQATELVALQPSAPYTGKDCDCSWVDRSVTACDGEDDGTICWRACCHATVSVTPPKAPLLKKPGLQPPSPNPNPIPNGVVGGASK